WTGVNEGVVDPFPSWPLEFAPQHLRLPLASRAHVENCPVATWLTFVSPGTVSGTKEFVVELFPNCPSSLEPQHFSDPPEITAHTCRSPRLMESALVTPPTCTGYG